MAKFRLPALSVAGIVLLSLCVSGASLRTNAAMKWAGYYGIERALVWAVVETESQFKWYATSDDYKSLKKKPWAWDVISTHGLSATNDWIWYSVGYMQVAFLVAYDLGYRGTVDALYNSDNNFHYGCKRLWQIMRDHKDMRIILWHYNQDWKYVEAVYARYKKNGGRR